MMECGGAIAVLCDDRLANSVIDDSVASLPSEQHRCLVAFLACYGHISELGRAIEHLRFENLKGDSLRLIALHVEAFPSAAARLYGAAWRKYQMQDPNRTEGLVLMSTTEISGIARMLVHVANTAGAVEGQGLQKTLQRLGDRIYQRMCDGKVSKSMVVDILEIFSGTWPAPIHEKVLQLGYALLLDNHGHTAIDDSECARVMQVSANAEYANMALNRILTMRLSSASTTRVDDGNVISRSDDDDGEDVEDTRASIRSFHSISENYNEVDPEIAHRLSFKALTSSVASADDAAHIIASLANYSTQNECTLALQRFCDKELTTERLCQMNMPQLSAVMLVLAMQQLSSSGHCSCTKAADRVTEYDYDPRAVRVVEKFYSSYKIGAARKGKMVRAPMVPKLVWHEKDKRWQNGNYQTRESVGSEPFDDGGTLRKECSCHPRLNSSIGGTANAVDSAIRRTLRVLAVGEVVMARSMGQLDVLRDFKEAEGGRYVPTVFDVEALPLPLPSKDDLLEVYNPPTFITRTDPDLQTVIATRPRPPAAIEDWIPPGILSEARAAASRAGGDFPPPSWSTNQRSVTYHSSNDVVSGLMLWVSSGIHGGLESLSLEELQGMNCILSLCEVFVHGTDPPEVRSDGVKHPPKRAFINSARPDRAENELRCTLTRLMPELAQLTMSSSLAIDTVHRDVLLGHFRVACLIGM
ncbi:hypothetical protein FOL47_005304 [Perkinsus chesapeaki]|uniref:Uncharacterized protein n=1 Tax=Perkinsus chesapeaki TaxID=330153 RepID=A0A7J6LXS3_PERCH|nr:hypothetical protein FOL47_005304 [Perkinsus chesapeaki]